MACVALGFNEMNLELWRDPAWSLAFLSENEEMCLKITQPLAALKRGREKKVKKKNK